MPELMVLSGRSEAQIRKHIACGLLTAVDLRRAGLLDPERFHTRGGGRLRVGILTAEWKRWVAANGRRPKSVLPEGTPDVWVPIRDVAAALGVSPYAQSGDQEAPEIDFPGRGSLRAWPLSRHAAWWKRRADRRKEEAAPFPFERFPASQYPLVEQEPAVHEPGHRLHRKRLQGAWRTLVNAGVIVSAVGNGNSHGGNASHESEPYRVNLYPEAVRALGRELEPMPP